MKPERIKKRRKYIPPQNRTPRMRPHRPSTHTVIDRPAPPLPSSDPVPDLRPVVINDKWDLLVPKILHAYWDGGLLPYIRYLTIKSFIRLNTDWKVILWYPKYPNLGVKWKTNEHNYTLICDDYLPKLLTLPIQVNSIDFTDLGLQNNIPEVHKSDFLRTHLLSTMGGVWTDMDIIYFNPITHLRINKAFNRNIETFVCICSYGHSTGFMMTQKNNGFFSQLKKHTEKEYLFDSYQCIGPELYNKYGKTTDIISKYSSVANIDMEAVYAHDAHHIHELWGLTHKRFTPHSIGVHWYAGHPRWGEFINNTNGGLSNLPHTIIGNVLRKINKDEMSL